MGSICWEALKWHGYCDILVGMGGMGAMRQHCRLQRVMLLQIHLQECAHLHALPRHQTGRDVNGMFAEDRLRLQPVTVDLTHRQGMMTLACKSHECRTVHARTDASCLLHTLTALSAANTSKKQCCLYLRPCTTSHSYTRSHQPQWTEQLKDVLAYDVHNMKR